jgi:hypothetical protein
LLILYSTTTTTTTTTTYYYYYYYYSTSFFEGIIDNPLQGTCLVNFVNVLATFLALQLMDSTHR